MKYDLFYSLQQLYLLQPEKKDSITETELNNFILSERKEHNYGNDAVTDRSGCSHWTVCT